MDSFLCYQAIAVQQPSSMGYGNAFLLHRKWTGNTVTTFVEYHVPFLLFERRREQESRPFLFIVERLQESPTMV